MSCLALFSITTHAETKFLFTGDANVRAYFKNRTSSGGTQAFNQFFRLNTQVKPDDNLTVKVGAVLASDNWEGDNHKSTSNSGTAIGGTNDDGFGNGNITHLDHAVIEYNKNNWIMSAGRHAVSTPGSFLTSDDRRDRLMLLKIRENYDVFAMAYDKRAEGSLTDSKDDLDMITVNYYGNWTGLRYALQGGYWYSKKFNNTTSLLNSANLHNIKMFAPQIEGKLGSIDFNFYYTILFGGKGAYYLDAHHAAALKLAHDFEIVKLEFQSTATLDGGFIANGFDTLSSVVNNSPDHNQSLIRLKSIGSGLGAKKADEYLNMLRASKALSNDLTASLGGGFGKIYNTTGGVLESSTIYDATAKYTISPNLSVLASYGKFFGDFKDHAGSLSLKAVF